MYFGGRNTLFLGDTELLQNFIGGFRIFTPKPKELFGEKTLGRKKPPAKMTSPGNQLA